MSTHKCRAAGVSCGRGADGRPVCVAQAVAVGGGRVGRPDPTIAQRQALMQAQLEEMLTHYGKAARRLARKHIAWYANGLPGSAQLRDVANNSTDAAAVFAAVDAFFMGLQDSEAA